MKRRFRLPLIIGSILCGCLLLLAVCVFFLLRSPGFVNALASSMEGYTGYRLHVQAISLDRHGSIDLKGLEVRDIRTGSFQLALASAEVKGGLTGSLGVEVERIVLTGPRFVFHMKKSKEAGNPFAALERLPPVRLLVVQDGELDLFIEEERFTLPGIHLTVKDFSPRAGGEMKMDGRLNIAAGAASGKGSFEAAFAMTRFSPSPSGKGSVRLSLDSGSFGTTAFETAALVSGVDISGDKLSFRGIKLTSSRIASGEKSRQIAITDAKVRADLSYDQKTSRFSLVNLSAAGVGIGSLQGECSGTLSPLTWTASAKASGIELPTAFAMVRPFVPAEYRSWQFKGKGGVDLHTTGQAGEPYRWKADVIVDVKEGGFASPDNLKAAERITGQIHLRMESPAPGKKGTFDVKASAGDGELLWGKFYRNFRGEMARVSSQGQFDQSPLSLSCNGSLDLFETGTYAFTADVSPETTALSLEAKNVSHKRLLAAVLSDFVQQSLPGMKDLAVDGESDLTVSARLGKDSTSLKGQLAVRNAAFRAPSSGLAVEGLQVSLPFDLAYPPPAVPSALTATQGVVAVDRIRGKKLGIGSFSVPVLLSQNTFLVPVQVDIPLFGGEARLTHCRIDNLLGTMKLDAGVSFDRVDLGVLTENLVPLPINGTIDGDLTSIRWEGDQWRTRGKITASVFGGEVEVTNIAGRRLFSRSRSIGGDVTFDSIDLEQLTSKIEVGKITGTIQGSAKGLQFEYGQPSAFVLDIETDPESKASRMISVDAIENISIIGTGTSAISSILNSGVHKFFKAYPYSKIGIQCTLVNDVFTLRGTVHEGGKEYLVRRALFRGIDVVNQNPDNSISFKDMQERLGRIFKQKEPPTIS